MCLEYIIVMENITMLLCVGRIGGKIKSLTRTTGQIKKKN